MPNPFAEPKKEEPKKPMIVEMKDKPEKVTVTEKEDKLILVIKMENESSAAGIDLDVSSNELKLQSEK